MEKFKLELSKVFHDQTCVKKCKRHTCRQIASSESFSTFRRTEDDKCRQEEFVSSVSSNSGRCYTENRNRLRRFCIYLLIFLLPLAVEVAASAASAELHKTRHESSRRHARDSFRHEHDKLRHRRFSVPDLNSNGSLWPAKRVAEIYGDIVIGGLHMIHEREDAIICGPVMPQGGLQASMKTSPILNELN